MDGPSGHADLSIPIYGPNGKGIIYVVADKNAGVWRFETLQVEIDGQPKRIDLLLEEDQPSGEGGARDSSSSVLSPSSPYTSRVLRMITSGLVLSLLVAHLAESQVRIVLSKLQYKAEEQIPAKLVNQGKHAITVCVQFGQSWPKGNDVEFVPTPFAREHNDNGRWHVLIDGPDIGSILRPVDVEPGKSVDFPFRLNDQGSFRLLLYYWSGSKEPSCSERSHDAKRVRSATFIVE